MEEVQKTKKRVGVDFKVIEEEKDKKNGKLAILSQIDWNLVEDEKKENPGPIPSRRRPEKPKKPASAYFCFMKHFFEQSKISGQKVSIKDASKVWNAMEASEKLRWTNEAKVLKEQYIQKLKEYEEVSSASSNLHKSPKNHQFSDKKIP